VLRVLLAAPLVLVMTLVLGVPALLAGAVDRSGRAAHGLAALWSRLLLRLLGVELRLVGAERLPDGPAVFAANHASVLDIPIVFSALPVPFRIIHKRSLYLLPLIGLYLWLAGHIGIDRGNPFRARRSLARAAERIRSGTSVTVFPEGTRSPDARVGLFKRGSFLLAIQAGTPVVPVSLAGVKELIPGGWLTLRPGRVVVTIHAPLPTSERDPDDAEALARECRSVVQRACEPAT
jgi:1-acyl-sn-glycerol-3-phosphate acyltransferase